MIQSLKKSILVLIALSFGLQQTTQARTYTTAEKTHIAAAILRLPLIVSTNIASGKYKPVFEISTDLIRLLDAMLTFYNHKNNKYTYFWTGYDLWQLGAHLAELAHKPKPISNDDHDEELVKQQPDIVRKSVLALIEASTALYSATSRNNTESRELKRLKIDALGSVARMFDAYLDTDKNSAKSNLLLALLITNIFSATMDWFKNPDNPGEGPDNVRARIYQPARAAAQPAAQAAHNVPLQEGIGIIPGVHVPAASIGEECPICCVPFEAEDVVGQIPCNHLQHQTCLQQWIDSGYNRTCTICRANIPY